MQLQEKMRRDVTLSLCQRSTDRGEPMLDLRAGRNAGVRFDVGVLTGAHSREVLAAEPHTHLLASVAELPPLLVGAAPGAGRDGGRPWLPRPSEGL